METFDLGAGIPGSAQNASGCWILSRSGLPRRITFQCDTILLRGLMVGLFLLRFERDKIILVKLDGINSRTQSIDNDSIKNIALCLKLIGT